MTESSEPQISNPEPQEIAPPLEPAPVDVAPAQQEMAPPEAIAPQIPVAEAAPLATVATAKSPVEERPNQLLGLPLQLLNQLLARIGTTPLSNLAELLPALRVLALLLLAGFVLKLTGATLGALNEIPMLGRLLELVGLISALNFLARNALRSQKRAELMVRIETLRREFLG